MSILERIQRIAKANVHWLLDKAETPEQMLEQKIRELEGAIQEGKEAAASYGATFKRMQREQEQLTIQQDEWQRKAAQALRSGDEPLTRKALAERLRLGDRIAALTPGVQQGRGTYEQLRVSLQELMDQLKAARAKLSELQARKRAAEAQKAFGRQADKVAAVTREDVDFEKFEDEVLQAEAAAEIEQEIRGDLSGDMDLEKRARELQIDAELEAMKKSMNKEGDE